MFPMHCDLGLPACLPAGVFCFRWFCICWNKTTPADCGYWVWLDEVMGAHNHTVVRANMPAPASERSPGGVYAPQQY